MFKCWIGVLIVIEMDIGLEEYIEIGILLDVEVIGVFLINIFIFNILFYDGVVIIKGGWIVVVVVYLLLLDFKLILKELGICYWVVVGILEVIDVLMIVIFEEIGGVLIIKDNELIWDMI